ncbi:hypothetical protein TWF225_001504 [Orbilia oligospora]|uniref:Uncharacterized protein n=1 Tax=Orbilia oligospora TaxID=2813651 RepID=A0A7C8U260_ORBOL|nr:hypothetical protein TWF751_010870 [Orbilia oligospora]KAF3191368.1 hypothetical protein TWF225_001504 [Orbilia oligospora]KAF3267834.1 hypothetical protein TWF217_011564 [Orbilia oligospora]KAF3269555.1 hypothetical protein TWF128_005761 [Orbilia oligospora]KAF3296550.1 hypothetical protein TWF132_010143 [Orbilia oligospora]
MRISEDQHILYALDRANTLLYGRVTKMRCDGLVEIAIRSGGRLNLIIENDSNRIQVLPNSITPEAEAVLETDDIDNVLKALETALDVGVTVAAAAAPGLAGGAAIMSGLAAIGGTAVGGILVVAGAPAFMAGNTIRKVIKRHENNTDTNDTVVVGMVAGGFVGSATAVGSVFAGGSVVGLSGAGITSGLASLGGGALASGGLGMVGGLVACTGIITIPVLSFGFLAWGLVAGANEADLQGEYRNFCRRWHHRGYRGPH